MKTLNQYTEWWEATAAALNLDFVYGGHDRVLNRQNMDLRYPCLWVGIPEIRRSRQNGALQKVFDGWFIVLQDAPTDDNSEQNAALNDTDDITEQVLARLYNAAMEGQFQYEPEESISHYKAKQTADDAWGWFTEFKITGGLTVEYLACP